MENGKALNPILELGYGRVDVTPDYPVGMAGSAATRVSEGTLDPITVTFLALRQGERLFLVATMDFVCTYEDFAEPLRERLSEATGIPRDCILLNSTHTHSSVAVATAKGEGIARYREDLNSRAVKGALEALEDLAPAELWYGSIPTEGMVWVRHYQMADGSYAGANYGSFASGVAGHAYEADGEMQLLRFCRKGTGKKDVVVMNFPAHATINQKSVLLSADFPAPAREAVAKKTGALVAYFIAGGGDQVPVSRVAQENFSTDYRVYGAEVGRLATEGLKGLRKAPPAALQLIKRSFVGESNKTDLDRAPEALAVKEIWDRVGGRGTAEGKKAAKDGGFSSVYEVTAILNRMHFEETRTMDLRVLSLGEVSLLFAPYEMFGVSAAQIKKKSPYEMTFIISCSQNHQGYLPGEKGCEIRCYEAQITKFRPGTAEELVEEYVDLLQQAKQEKESF